MRCHSFSLLEKDDFYDLFCSTSCRWIFFHKQGGIGATDILHVRLNTYEDGTCRGTAQIEFATAEAVNKVFQVSCDLSSILV